MMVIHMERIRRTFITAFVLVFVCLSRYTVKVSLTTFNYMYMLYMGHYQKMEESRKTKSLKISVKFFNLAATFIPNIHEGTNIQNMRSLTRRIIGQLIILCLLLRLKCQCSHKQTFYH